MKFLIYLQLGSNTKLLREITGIFRIVQDRPVLVLGFGPTGFDPWLVGCVSLKTVLGLDGYINRGKWNSSSKIS